LLSVNLPVNFGNGVALAARGSGLLIHTGSPGDLPGLFDGLAGLLLKLIFRPQVFKRRGSLLLNGRFGTSAADWLTAQLLAEILRFRRV
jgi:hypothetical protein